MKELIAITRTNMNGEEVNSVNARDLHTYLESKKDFSNWIKARIEKYGFEENADYIRVEELAKKGEHSSAGIQGKIEYILSLDVAKELAMVESNEKGRQIRKYFIEVEKKYRNIEGVSLIERQYIELPSFIAFLQKTADAFNLQNDDRLRYFHSEFLKKGYPTPDINLVIKPSASNVKETPVQLGRFPKNTPAMDEATKKANKIGNYYLSRLVNPDRWNPEFYEHVETTQGKILSFDKETD